MSGSRDIGAMRGAWPSLLRPPVFPDPELTESAQTFHWVALATAGVVTALLLIVGASQTELFGRALRNIVIIDSMVLATLAINRLGHPRVASWIYLSVTIGLITFAALSAGGIRSPGVSSWFIFAMLAGLLLGYRAGVLVALACVLIGLGLVVAEQNGIIASTDVQYTATTRWLLLSMYLGVTLLTLRAVSTRLEHALQRTLAELRQRRAAEHRLVRALAAGRIGTFELDLRSNGVLADERALQITGLEVEADGTVAFPDWFDRVHPDDHPAVFAQLQAFRSGAPEGRLSYRFLPPSGDLRHFEVAASLMTDDDGAPHSVLGMITDVTDRQRSAQEREELVQSLGERVKELRLLHEAAQLLQQASGIDRPLLTELVDRIPRAWLHADASARITYRDITVTSTGWSESPWQQTATFSTSEGTGRVDVCYHQEHEEHEEGPFLAEERALLNSLAKMLRVHAEQWEAENQRQRLESQLRQAQRLDELGMLAGGIAHDFNNILTAIGGYAELAINEGAQGATADSLREILRAHGRARDLVRRILLFSRRDEETKRELVDIAAVVDEAIELLRASLPPSVRIHVEAETELPMVLADATQIHQVIMNLGTNAGYAMRGGPGTLSITLGTTNVDDEGAAPSAALTAGRHVVLTVRDTGTGMSQAVMDRLFEPFFTTKGQAGTGLGLAVVHGIVRDHAGAVTVSSEPGVGTEFSVFLPALRTDAHRDTRTESLVHGDQQHIMYVDDQPTLARLMSRTLQRLGYRCTEFTDADAALREFRATPDAFDAVITDLQMPTMTGAELINRLRAIRPDFPAAIVSGYASARDADIQITGVAWLSKPASLSEISSVVHTLMSAAAIDRRR
jgi:PAS domain S-box-containing protein